MPSLAYPDLLDSDFVFEALLGHGMFADKLPSCFSSEGLLEFAKKGKLSKDCDGSHAYVEYQATRNTNIPRQLAIPHPKPYWELCYCVKSNWELINRHIGQPEKFNFCHVRRIRDKKRIFEMSYTGSERWQQEELLLDYALGCKYVVSADISTFFPSVYAHSIPWAVKGKVWAKQHRCNSFNKKKNKGENCKTNDKQPCPCEKGDLWPNDLDTISRSIKDDETNGLLIGPHTSNIISEIILSRVDLALQEKGFLKVIRHVDDYLFFAKDENEANDFLRTLVLELKEYELILNAKKTRIVPYQDFTDYDWVGRLKQFSFPEREEIGFTSVSLYIDYARSLSMENNDFAPLNYAIKVIVKKNLSTRARRLYIKKITQIALSCPYLLPLLEEYVFFFADNDYFLEKFLSHLFERSIQRGSMDSLAFVFHYAIKYGVKLEDFDCGQVVHFNDCVSMLLAHKYFCHQNMTGKIDIFRKKANELLGFSKRNQDKFWLFLYEVLDADKLSGFLRELKEENVCFLKAQNV